MNLPLPPSSRLRRFDQVDVFGLAPLRGNGLAVVHDAAGLDTATMQRFTDWTQLSECTFLLPPDDPQADYRVRIFCPGRELPFAGHPTLGSAWAWLAAGGRPRTPGRPVQQCAAGRVRLRLDGERLSFEAPPLLRAGPLPPASVERLAAGLGLRPREVRAAAWCDNGPGWQALLIDDAERLLALAPDPALLRGLDFGVVAPALPGGGCDLELRAFFAVGDRLVEDPVTGSLNAAVAQWLIGAGLAPARYVAAQGTALGRAGRVHLHAEDGAVWVGGAVASLVSGQVAL